MKKSGLSTRSTVQGHGLSTIQMQAAYLAIQYPMTQCQKGVSRAVIKAKIWPSVTRKSYPPLTFFVPKYCSQRELSNGLSGGELFGQ